jgi:hypothetical protein
MKTIQFLFVCLAMSMLTLRAADEASIETCPPIGWNFRIVPYLSVAKSLQEEGSEKAILRLRSWANTGKHEDQVVILCRMLFEAKKGQEFRRPRIGGAAFFGGTDYPDWPLEPIDIYESIPILITNGYILGGVPEPSGRYLDFCVNNCEWRQARYSVRSHDELKAIVAKWLTSRKWTVALSARDLAFFTNQAEQDGTGQPATRPESKSEGGDKPQPEAEGRSR